ncbi:MAG: hypothetical protein K8T89_25010 [Planctomycetes bacterium]|nr:hypothetical protein [Planctomycetota bacterium]
MKLPVHATRAFSFCSIALFLWASPLRSADEHAKKTGSIDDEVETVVPGLVASYRSMSDAKAAFTRVEAKPSFFLGRSSPDPRIPPGPFEVVWTGVVDVAGSAPLQFDAYLCGELTIEVDGDVVLQRKGENETSRVGPGKLLELRGGMYRLKIRYQSLDQAPARLQIWWRGDSFTREPLPAWRLKHVVKEVPARLSNDQLADQGRHLVGSLGCVRCHQSSLPGVSAAPPGPALGDLRQRVSKEWLLGWLNDPSAERANAKMPKLFDTDRTGYVERYLIVEHLLGAAAIKPEVREPTGSHRMGRRHFVNFGCAACHQLPDAEAKDQLDLGRIPLTGLKDRMPADHLASFLSNPNTRYSDGRMPRLPLTPEATRDIATYLLEFSTASVHKEATKPPTEDEIKAVSKTLKISERADVGAALVAAKRCAQCHEGLGQSVPRNIPLVADPKERGCLSDKTLPSFKLEPAAHKAITAYLPTAVSEKHPSLFASRQRLVEHLGCVKCHQRDSDRPSSLEATGSTLGGAWLWNIPFQRAPRLSNPHQKFTREHLRSAIAEGVVGLRLSSFTYRMPAFGNHADAVVQALAEADGELPEQAEPPPRVPDDPTLATLTGPTLVGFQGYSCISCHAWNGKAFGQPDPGAVGTDLTRLKNRIRRDWFDRYLEAPTRVHPGSPMPSIFMKGRPATLANILDGNAAKQKDALWAYFSLGKDAVEPKPPPPVPIAGPAKGEDALVAQIPVRLPSNALIDSICVLTDQNDLFIYDLTTFSLLSAYTGAQIQRTTQGRDRMFRVAGTLVGKGFHADTPLQLIVNGKPETPVSMTLQSYERQDRGVQIRWQANFAKSQLEIVEIIRLVEEGKERWLTRIIHCIDVGNDQMVELRSRSVKALIAAKGRAKKTITGDVLSAILTPDEDRAASVASSYELPASQMPPAFEQAILPDLFKIEDPLERPGYKAIMYPRPKTIAKEDALMPAAVAVNPKDGRVFVASMKTGSIFVLNDPSDDGKSARFDDYAHGLFQEAYSMLAKPEGLYVLHRRSLTRIAEKETGKSAIFERVASVNQATADAYDYGYGLARDKSGAFIIAQAPHADRKLPGAGNAMRIVPGKKPETIAYGFRNPIGWCAGTDGEIFFTDNQGEWVATNKLCHLQEGKFHGYPNAEQKEHAKLPAAKTSVWVPYAWAKSINGVTYDTTGGKFGPFAGQFFMAELMFGGAIVRADMEKVNGVYQGSCFPFWGQGLLGPLSLAFDPKGRLYVGSIHEPAWMAQPDRGALFRLEFTGQTPFEMQKIRVLPNGFRVFFTTPVSAKTASELASYRIESFRYEYTGAYGSPEYDRKPLKVESLKVAEDGLSVDLLTAPLVKDRVYMVEARGVRSKKDEALVHPMGAYTLNEIPVAKP